MNPAAQVTLLSETDSRGIITFANDAFCKTSKYRRDELVGKRHNIIRHPDMPKELFEHLWRTIIRGEVFKGVLKNKASDGSHYWVNATIMSIRDRQNNIEKCIGIRHLIQDDAQAVKLFEAQARLLGIASQKV